MTYLYDQPDEPQTFREPDEPREADEELWCCVCSAVIHADDGVGCEAGCGAAHRETCARETNRGDGTFLCLECASAKEGA